MGNQGRIWHRNSKSSTSLEPKDQNDDERGKNGAETRQTSTVAPEKEAQIRPWQQQILHYSAALRRSAQPTVSLQPKLNTANE